jgi:hypothetical protein
MTPLCSTCHGDCCVNKRGSVVDHGSALALHSCPDCPDGFAPAPDLAAARLAALLVAECENTALRAEMAHLRGERAAVVTWLRVAWGAMNLVSTEIVSAEIERGEHRREEKP